MPCKYYFADCGFVSRRADLALWSVQNSDCARLFHRGDVVRTRLQLLDGSAQQALSEIMQVLGRTNSRMCNDMVRTEVAMILGGVEVREKVSQLLLTVTPVFAPCIVQSLA